MDMDRRSGIERRMSSSINIRSLIYGGNRILIRRQEDRERLFFVDQYSPLLFVPIVAILFLCVLDALLTLILLNHGAYEANPIMAHLLNIDPYAFYVSKYAITIIATFGLFLLRGIVIQKLNLSVHSLLYFIAGLYSVVVAWELYLVSDVVI
jgi:hypothetical protein